ncbi:MAG: riboflavin biosynthesis protein RibF [Paludibacteraceae bacterium]|nr:riboflavin biosynthesis protein RibF [Paludibacteraceae bacterium]
MRKIATIGFFDGVHKGHRFLFSRLRQEAYKRSLEPLIVTFDHHPRSVLQTDYVPQLLTLPDERKALLANEAKTVFLSFEDVHTLTAAEFIKILHEEYDVDVLMMGYDHQFGSDRLRHPQDYRRVGAEYEVEIITMGEFIDGEWHVSSTEIRQALENGNIALANELLGYPYQLSGTVVHGNGIGRQIGFPTANICPDSNEKIIPKNGVFVVSTILHGIGLTRGILNIGTNPTVGNTNRTIELHIPGFHGDLYGQSLVVCFERFVREEKKFDTLEDLRRQIKDDLAEVP